MSNIHDPNCSAVYPCEFCNGLIDDAKTALNAYDDALSALDEIASMPWVIRNGGTDTKDFWLAYETIKNFAYAASRKIPRNI